MKIELLYFKTCPSYELALERLRRVLHRQKIDAQVEMVEVDSAEDARQLCFLGSPSIRINGLDVEHGARSRTDWGLMCRMYDTGSALEGSPSEEMITSALLEALNADSQAPGAE
ncbi:MAG: DF family (seleno)protein [Armatimonadota bacterium]